MKMDTKEYLFGSIFLLSNKLQALGDSYLQEITVKQWFLLVMIQHISKEQPSITEIAASIGSTRQNVRKMLEVLSAKGFVQLTVNPQDKRNLSVSLTEQTYLFFKDFDDKGTAFLEQFFNGISAEQLESSRETFEALFQNMDRMENRDEKSSSHL